MEKIGNNELKQKLGVISVGYLSDHYNTDQTLNMLPFSLGSHGCCEAAKRKCYWFAA